MGACTNWAAHRHAPLRRLPLQEQAAGRASLWVLKEDVHRGKGVAVASPAQALWRALEHAPSGGWLGGGWSWRSLLGGGGWSGWHQLLRIRIERAGWCGALGHAWHTWNGAMNRLWRAVRGWGGWRGWAGAGGATRHVLAQQFLGEQYLVQGRPFYIR